MTTAGGQALLVPTDVADPEQVEAAAQAVEDQFGPIDIWVNNAMVSVFSPVTEMTPTLGYRGIPLQVAYCGAKPAIQGFHDSLRCELLHDSE